MMPIQRPAFLHFLSTSDWKYGGGGKPIYLPPLFFYTRSSEDFAALWASLTELRRVIVEAVIGGDWCV